MLKNLQTKNAPTGGKAKCYEIKLTRTNTRLTKKLFAENHFSSEEYFYRKQNLTILSLGQDKAVNKAGCTRQDEPNTLATRTGEDKDYIHIRGREHRWKESGIRGDARLVT